MSAIDNKDSGRLGKATELLVAATCILTSDLRLNASTSFVDDEGVDLVFFERGRPKTLAVQVKARRTTGKQLAAGTFIANVGASTFQPRDDLYLLFVSVDTGTGTLRDVWLVPSVEFSAILSTPNGKGRFVFRASAKRGTKDRWARFKCEPNELAAGLLAALAAAA